MKQFLLGLSISFAFILGCVTAAAVNSTARAAPVAGGTECFATSLYFTTGRSLNQGEIPETVVVPPGWTPLGGSAGSGAGMVVCRAVASQ